MVDLWLRLRSLALWADVDLWSVVWIMVFVPDLVIIS